MLGLRLTFPSLFTMYSDILSFQNYIIMLILITFRADNNQVYFSLNTFLNNDVNKRPLTYLEMNKI